MLSKDTSSFTSRYDDAVRAPTPTLVVVAMEEGGVRVNVVKQKEQRLRRMQIELGRARLVSRPWDLLQQPVNIIPPPDPDRDLDLSGCLLYTSPSPRDMTISRMPSSA